MEHRSAASLLLVVGSSCLRLGRVRVEGRALCDAVVMGSRCSRLVGDSATCRRLAMRSASPRGLPADQPRRRETPRWQGPRQPPSAPSSGFLTPRSITKSQIAPRSRRIPTPHLLSPVKGPQTERHGATGSRLLCLPARSVGPTRPRALWETCETQRARGSD